jgi:cell division protein FtsB
MRVVTYILLILILLLQYPLWLGKGSWMKVWDMNRRVEAQQAINQKNEKRNALLNADVLDLKSGTEAIEERARRELGMIKKDEKFYQFLDDSANQVIEKSVLKVSASEVTGVIRLAP